VIKAISLFASFGLFDNDPKGKLYNVYRVNLHKSFANWLSFETDPDLTKRVAL
jgi:hypothetical protein